MVETKTTANCLGQAPSSGSNFDGRGGCADPGIHVNFIPVFISLHNNPISWRFQLWSATASMSRVPRVLLPLHHHHRIENCQTQRLFITSNVRQYFRMCVPKLFDETQDPLPAFDLPLACLPSVDSDLNSTNGSSHMRWISNRAY